MAHLTAFSANKGFGHGDGNDEDDDEAWVAVLEAVESDASNKRRKLEDPSSQSEGLYTAALKGRNSHIWNTTNRVNTAKFSENFSRGGGASVGNVSADQISDACFKCGQKGHWSRDCAVIANKEGGDLGFPVPEKVCPCGAGSCLVLTANTEKNRGRKFFRCPVKDENGGCRFFEWCDASSVVPMAGAGMQCWPSSYASNSSVPDIQCPCGAGSCLVLTAKTEKNMGQQFYRCPANQGTGSCGFFKWCNEHNLPSGASTRAPQVSTTWNNTTSPLPGGKIGSTCFKCGQDGHWARDCPKPSSGPGPTSIDAVGRSTSSGTCYKCGEVGHWARDCASQVSNAGSGSRNGPGSFRTSRGKNCK